MLLLIIVFFCGVQVYVEFDDQEWEKREWVKVYEDFQLFLLEHQLVWAKRKEGAGAGAGGGAGGLLQGTKVKHTQWPALVRLLLILLCYVYKYAVSLMVVLPI